VCVYVKIILIIKPTRCTNFSNFLWNRNLHVSDRFSVHHQESSTVHTATGIGHTGYADGLLRILGSVPKINLRNQYISLDFFIRIYQDARSSECQISKNTVVKMQAMKAYRERVELQAHLFLTSALDRVMVIHTRHCFTLQKEPSAHIEQEADRAPELV